MLSIKRYMGFGLVFTSVVYLVLVTGMYVMQNKLLFPNFGSYVPPEKLGVSLATEHKINTPDGETLMMWFKKAELNMPTLLYFHGNAGSISGRHKRFDYYAKRGFGVLFVEYRGYGVSTGSPGEAGFRIDARTGYDWLINQGISASSIVIVGESMGTGIATLLASEVPSAALLLEAPYTSIIDVAESRYWFTPVRMLINHEFNALGAIAKVSAPVLMQHGVLDSTVPMIFGKKLFAAANEPKTFIEIPDAGHAIFNAPTFAREVSFLAEHLKLNIPVVE